MLGKMIVDGSMPSACPYPMDRNDPARRGGLHRVQREQRPTRRKAAPRVDLGPDISVDDEAAKAMVDRALEADFQGLFTGLVERQAGCPIGAAILNRYTGPDVHLTVVAQPLTQTFIRAIARVCFIDFKVARVTAITRPSNRPAILALRRAGFVLEAALRDFYRNEDGVQYRLLASEQRLVERI